MKSTEKERLIKSDILSIESRVRHAFNQGYDLGYKDGLQKSKTVTEFADRCRECGAKYGKLLKQKTGHWIFKQFDEETGISNSYWCSKCGKPQGQVYKTYCASCGAKMIEPQETETWNGIHARITAPKGTFERIFNDADDDNDI